MDGRQHKTHHGGCVHVSLELFLSDEVIEQLHDFEEECLDAYFHEGERKQLCSVEERIRLTTERSVITDHIQSIQLNDMWLSYFSFSFTFIITSSFLLHNSVSHLTLYVN